MGSVIQPGKSPLRNIPRIEEVYARSVVVAVSGMRIPTVRMRTTRTTRMTKEATAIPTVRRMRKVRRGHPRARGKAPQLASGAVAPAAPRARPQQMHGPRLQLLQLPVSGRGWTRRPSRCPQGSWQPRARPGSHLPLPGSSQQRARPEVGPSRPRRLQPRGGRRRKRGRRQHRGRRPSRGKGPPGRRRARGRPKLQRRAAKMSLKMTPMTTHTRTRTRRRKRKKKAPLKIRRSKKRGTPAHCLPGKPRQPLQPRMSRSKGHMKESLKGCNRHPSLRRASQAMPGPQRTMPKSRPRRNRKRGPRPMQRRRRRRPRRAPKRRPRPGQRLRRGRLFRRTLCEGAERRQSQQQWME
mmetsp:Transcript_46127/g.128312  ORF Transcript_46127/g.128312 Transcript_46127/m.128312 type:complete len:352 (-) Transcript_46127:786-1841(-)